MKVILLWPDGPPACDPPRRRRFPAQGAESGPDLAIRHSFAAWCGETHLKRFAQYQGAARNGSGRSLSITPFGQQHRDLSLGPLLILRVPRIGLDGPLPPDLPLLALQLSSGCVDKLDTVLHHQRLGISFQVEIPLRMFWRAALRGDHRVLAVMLHPHQGNLSDLATFPAPSGEEDNRSIGAGQRVGLAASSGLISLDLLARLLPRTWFVLPRQWHAPIIESPLL